MKKKNSQKKSDPEKEEEKVTDKNQELIPEEEVSSDNETVEFDYQALEEKWLRLRADFDNFRKRTIREKERWSQLAMENIMIDMLVVLDHFTLGLENAKRHEAKTTVFEGFQMVYTQFENLLKKHQLEAIDALDSRFDPSVHEAINYLPSDDVEANYVLEQTRCGYKLGDRLLRAAQVVVSSGPENTSNEEDHGDQ